jgi:2-amino-4-hydroxy-6-hydroxymethyldihydropteridine diphosphokinase
MTAVEVVLAVGSNVGDRAENLRRGLRALSPQVSIERVSSLYETAPWGVADQPEFLNAVLTAMTALEPLDLLGLVKHIEADVGRTSGVRWGPRVLDIDILYYGDLVFDHPSLQIPHLRIAERPFVLVPLTEIAGSRTDPRSGVTVRRMLARAGSAGVRKVAAPGWADAGA